MNSRAETCRPAIVVLALTLGACASPRENAIFVTKTSLSVIDMESMPVSVTVAFDRTEGYIGPRFNDGNIYPVVGYLEATGRGLSRDVKQTYATGCAARMLTKPEAPKAPECNHDVPPAPQEKLPVMFFATSTTLGLKIALQAASLTPESFTFGYKRKEASIIPVDETRQPSVLASLDTTGAAVIRVNAPSSTDAKASPPAANSNSPAGDAPNPAFFTLTQFFATGVAAEQLALSKGVSDTFKSRAETAVGEVQMYKNTQGEQGRIALDTLACFSHVPDASLSRVWSDVESQKVFGDRAPKFLKTVRATGTTPLAQRQTYAEFMTTLDAASPDYTTTLKVHRATVCALGS